MSADTVGWFQQLQNRFIDLSKRERVLILLTGLVIILLVGFLWFIEPALNKTNNAKKEARRLNAQVVGLEQQIAAIEAQLEQDPDKSVKDRIALNRRDLERLDLQLQAHTSELVPPGKMPALLETVLGKSDKLTLREMRSIAPTQLLKIEDEDTAQTNLYQHGVQLVLEGRYFDIQEYLESIETLPWQFYWKRFSYRVTEYPLAQVEIELYTLSTSPAFIGVWKDV